MAGLRKEFTFFSREILQLANVKCDWLEYSSLTRGERKRYENEENL